MRSLFSNKKVIIGMVHLKATPGFPNSSNDEENSLHIDLNVLSSPHVLDMAFHSLVCFFWIPRKANNGRFGHSVLSMKEVGV